MKDLSVYDLLAGYSINSIENGFIVTVPRMGRCPTYRYFEELSKALNFVTSHLMEKYKEQNKMNQPIAE